MTRMHSALGSAGLALTVILAFTASAAAQRTHGGVSIESVVPETMELLDVVVPDRAQIPVRVTIGPRGAQTAELLIDVLVAPDMESADHALDWQIRTNQGEVASVTALGDRGFADDGYAAFVRDNILVVVRRIGGAHDVRALAAHIDRAIMTSPRGSTRATTTVQMPDANAMRPGESARIALPTNALEVLVRATGDVTARRTRDGILVTRTGSAAAHLEAIVVDRQLRTNH